MKNTRVKVSMLPIFLVLAFAFVVFLAYQFDWVALLTGGHTAHAKSGEPDTQVTVWVNTRSGIYYCPDSSLYGKTLPGESMKQGDALQHGYRPAEDRPCQGLPR